MIIILTDFCMCVCISRPILQFDIFLSDKPSISHPNAVFPFKYSSLFPVDVRVQTWKTPFFPCHTQCDDIKYKKRS